MDLLHQRMKNRFTQDLKEREKEIKMMAHEEEAESIISISNLGGGQHGWETIRKYIQQPMEKRAMSKETLKQISEILEQDFTTPWYVLVEFLSQFPKELGFSVLLATMRYFLPGSNQKIRIFVLESIFCAIERYYESFIHHIENMDMYDKQRYHCSQDTVVGEALILSWDRYNNMVNTNMPPSNSATNAGIEIFKLIFHKFPNCILYLGPRSSPIHEACTHHPFKNIELFKFFIEQHFATDPSLRGGLYNNQYGQTPIGCLAEMNNKVIAPMLLKYLSDCKHSCPPLLQAQDVTEYALLHKAVSSDAPIETIQFFIELNPHSILAQDSYGESPLDHFYFSRIAFNDSKILQEETLEILKLLLVKGNEYEQEQQQSNAQSDPGKALTTIGGLLQPRDPFLSAFIEGTGIGSHNAVRLIQSCLQGVKYCEAPIIHAAITNVHTEHLKCLLDIYGASSRDLHGSLPLQHALDQGLTWFSGIKDIVAAYPGAVMEIDVKTGLPLFAQAATAGKSGDLDTIFGLLCHCDHTVLINYMLSKSTPVTPGVTSVQQKEQQIHRTPNRHDLKREVAVVEDHHAERRLDLVEKNMIIPNKRTKLFR